MDLLGRDKTLLRQVWLEVTGLNWVTSRAVGIPYQTLNDRWRICGNIRGSLTSVTTSLLIAIDGLLFKSGTEINQPCACYLREQGVADRLIERANCTPGTANIDIRGNGNFNSISLSFDVELESKPDFA